MSVLFRTLSLLLPAALVSGCSRVSEPARTSNDDDPPAVAVTVWSERTELFMEYPPLVAGEQVRFAIHLTDLADFSPVREGRVVVRFEARRSSNSRRRGPPRPASSALT